MHYIFTYFILTYDIHEKNIELEKYIKKSSQLSAAQGIKIPFALADDTFLVFEEKTGKIQTFSKTEKI